MSPKNIPTDAAVAAEFAIGATALQHFIPHESGNFAIVPDDWRVECLEDLQIAPNRMRAHQATISAPGFIGYINRWATASALVEIDWTCPRIHAVLDHGTAVEAGFRDHSIALRPRISVPLKRWLDIAKRPLSQRALAEFLDEHAVEVSVPDAASIMDMVLTFEATKKVVFKSGVRLQNGDRQLTFSEDTQGTSGSVVIPERITIVAPVFEGADAQLIDFTLRYRIEDGAVAFSLKMHREDEVIRHAFQQIVDEVNAGLSDVIPRPFLDA